MKLEGGQNDLLERIAADPAFPLTREEIEAELDPQKYIGRCPGQVTEFLENCVRPMLDKYYAGDIAAGLKV